MYLRRFNGEPGNWPRRGPDGFTLLELVVSLTLLAIIALVVSGIARVSHGSLAKGEKRMTELARMRKSLAIITSQIESCAALPLDGQGGKTACFEGTESAMRFATNYSLWRGQKGNVVVRYHVGDDDRGNRRLSATESLTGTENQREEVLLAGMKAIGFEYFATEGTDGKGAWQETWNDDLRTPEKVRISIMSGRKRVSVIVTVRVREAG